MGRRGELPLSHAPDTLPGPIHPRLLPSHAAGCPPPLIPRPRLAGIPYPSGPPPRLCRKPIPFAPHLPAPRQHPCPLGIPPTRAFAGRYPCLSAPTRRAFGAPPGGGSSAISGQVVSGEPVKAVSVEPVGPYPERRAPDFSEDKPNQFFPAYPRAVDRGYRHGRPMGGAPPVSHVPDILLLAGLPPAPSAGAYPYPSAGPPTPPIQG